MSLKQRPSLFGRISMGLVFLFLYAPIFVLIVVVCMLVMNRFGEGEEQAVML